MRFTVFGASGFIGSNLVYALRARGHEVYLPARNEIECDQHLGHVIYAIGMTGDFRDKPFETVDAHVTSLVRRLEKNKFDSWLYLSSTRVYGTTTSESAREVEAICTRPGRDGIYDISKLLGESLCLANDNDQLRVARLSNVYGEGQSRDTFVGSLLQEAYKADQVTIRESSDSSKDYISIQDVTGLLEQLCLGGRHRIYNIASGIKVTHGELAQKLSTVTRTAFDFEHDAPKRAFPRIENQRIIEEFGYKPHSILDDIKKLVQKTRDIK